MLGNNDVNLNDIESKLASFKYMMIQFGNILSDFSVNMTFILSSIFKISLSQHHSFEEYFEEEADTHEPLIGEVENSNSRKDANGKSGTTLEIPRSRPQIA